MKFSPLLTGSLSLLLVACSNESSTEILPIDVQQLQQEWQLVSLDNSLLEATQSSTLIIDMQAKANGNLACNNFFGNVEVQDNKVRLDKMGSTRKMCADTSNELEMAVSQVLSTWSEANLSGQTLTLKGVEHTLVYKIK